MLDPEALLASVAPPLDLDARLARIRSSAERIWRVPRLPWFTDHSATRHSRRIVQLIGGLIEELQNGPQALSAPELFILLGAAYLHDIGMQDFRLDGRGPDEFDIRDYEAVRSRHPQRAKELIVARSLNLEPGRDNFRIDIDDSLEYLVPIALVSQGHGSSYFEATVDQFAEADYAPENAPIRGGLLTGLLLYADELDLHEDRSSFPQEMDQSAISALHHHVNHYVTRVAIRGGATKRFRAVQLSFEFPTGSDDYDGAVCAYVAGKLARQARRVNPVLKRDTDDGLEVDPVTTCKTRREPIVGARRPLPAAALCHLRLDLWEEQVIGRDALLDAVRESVTRRAASVIELIADDESDLPTALSWLVAYANVNDTPFLHADFELSVGTEPQDLIEYVAHEAISAGLSGVVPTGASLADVFSGVEQFSICVFEGLSSLAAESRTWLVREIVALRDSGAPVLVVATRDGADASTLAGATSFSLAPLSEDCVTRHLIRRFGLPAETAEVDARELVTLSGGAPARISTILAARARRDWVLA